MLCAAPLLLRADDAVMPGPARAPRHASAAAENARCESCHADIAAEWRASLHRKAHTDPAYQRALAIEPLAFCRGCHAPEADPSRDPPPDLGNIGVGCVTCHSTSSGVLAAPRAGSESAPHGIVRSAAFASDGACAACHEFSFPDPERRSHRELMQSTVSEHRASPFAAMACASCHMPKVISAPGRTHRSHAFAASRDATFVRSAAHVTATRAADGAVEVRLAPSGVGHAFPTGDLFRRLAVHVEAVGAESHVVAEETRYLARRFGKARGTDGHPIKVLVADTRVVSSGDTVVRLSLGSAAKGLPIAWRVAYERVEHPIDDASDAAVVEGEIEIAKGMLR
ncbi:Cytochrome C553 [Minicystis rosea]|nr:Cytochrome C553 [Minicystis rosea]